jgi:hypothetical protein
MSDYHRDWHCCNNTSITQRELPMCPFCVGGGEWRAHFYRVAKILGCLPSSFPDGNEHVMEKARALSRLAGVGEKS